MTSRRVYRMSDPVEPLPTQGMGYVLFFWIGIGLGYVLGKYLP